MNERDAATRSSTPADDAAPPDALGRVPLLTATVLAALRRALATGSDALDCSLDLELTRTRVGVATGGFTAEGREYPWPERCRERTVCYWTGDGFAPVQRYTDALVKLVPTEWGPPTFEIDGVKMLPTLQRSPWEDARAKVELVAPQGRRVLDTCGGLGYFAAWCLRLGAAGVRSWEKSADVRWLRRLNPWSPDGPWQRAAVERLELVPGDVAAQIAGVPAASFDAALHDPPRFGLAGELYSQAFYDDLARVLRPRARLFHWTGTPNRLTSGRDVPNEVAARLRRAGFETELRLDGVLAVRARGRARG